MGDDFRSVIDRIFVTISIHVPTWGTTWFMFSDNTVLHDFNPRPHVGDDERIGVIAQDVLISIHVPTWGTTPTEKRIMRLIIFQSTSPRGGRLAVLIGFGDGVISIHVPTWGTTHPLTTQMVIVYFNPRPHVGDDSISDIP